MAQTELLSLKIALPDSESNILKTLQFGANTIVYDASTIIRDKIEEARTDNAQEYGLFLPDDDPTKGIWLETGRTFRYYLLKNGDLLEYRKRMRPLRFKMLDGSYKTILIDDSHVIGQLLNVICARVGISNHDEYSLLLETSEPDGTSTLPRKAAIPSSGTIDRRDKNLSRDQKKMDQLRKKLHTDDELNWLDHTKTLREQSVDENTVLTFKRKYFYSDQNIDSRDPVQLNLLFVQTKDAILDGTHPVSFDTACLLAAYYCQSQFGDFVDNKHKTGYFEKNKTVVFPREYSRTKGGEKKILQDWKTVTGLSELDSKLKYVQTCRSLSTYGVTFFLVKEKSVGRNKLVPRLLGITKESVMRVDEKTKEILKTWPLTSVRRWAASPKSFTLDFGDYSDSFYSMQTTEGEQISALIAGYIDITLKKKKIRDRVGIEGDEDATLLEDVVSPNRATIVSHQLSRQGQAQSGSVAVPGVIRNTGGSGGQFTLAAMNTGGQSVISGGFAAQGHQAVNHGQPSRPQIFQPRDQAQKALLGNINAGFAAVNQARNELQSMAQLPPLGTDPASMRWKETQLTVNKHGVMSNLSGMTSATATIVMDSGDDTSKVGSAIGCITSNLPELAKGVKMVSSLLDPEAKGDHLMEAARNLTSSFTDLLTAAQPGEKDNRPELLNAASTVGQAGNSVMSAMGEKDPDDFYHDELMAFAKNVANATAALVMNAKKIQTTIPEKKQQDKLIASAAKCAISTSNLVCCAKVVSCTIDDPQCQEELVRSAKQVARNVEEVIMNGKEFSSDEDRLNDLGLAATNVTQCLNELLDHVKNDRKKKSSSPYEESCDGIISSTDKLLASKGNAIEMVRQARSLAQATSTLVEALRREAEGYNDNPEMQRNLILAAKMVADATAHLVEVAKRTSKNPNSSDLQETLCNAADDLRIASNSAAGSTIRQKIVSKLEICAKQIATISQQTVSAAQRCGEFNRNQTSQKQLIQDCKDVGNCNIPLVSAIKNWNEQPENPSTQLELITTCQAILPTSTKLVSSSRAALPTIGDRAASNQLSQCTKNLTHAISELHNILGKAQDACGSLEIDSALDVITIIKKDLLTMQETKLMPLPGETLESASYDVATNSKSVGSCMAQLLTSAAQGNGSYTGIAARDTANSLKVLINAIRGVAATTDDPNEQAEMLKSAMAIVDSSLDLTKESKRALDDPNHPDNQQNLASVAKAVSQSLNNCVNRLPWQRDVVDAMKTVSRASEVLNTSQFPQSERGYPEVQADIQSAASNLNVTVTHLLSASGGESQKLVDGAKQLGTDLGGLIQAGTEMAGQTPNKDSQITMVTSLKSISMASSKLLLATKSQLADPSTPNIKNQLQQAAKAVTVSINGLINACIQTSPGQKQCDNALRNIQLNAALLDNPCEPINDMSYFDCLDAVKDQSAQMGEGVVQITDSAKNGQLENFAKNVEFTTGAVCGLIEAAGQAAYLIGISDPASQPGKPGLVDIQQFTRATSAIQQACSSLIPVCKSGPREAMSLATLIAKQTSIICNICRIASSRTSNPVAKKHFVEGAKSIANSTSTLIMHLKNVKEHMTDTDIDQCVNASKPLLDSVDQLSQFVSLPEYSSIPAKISLEAKRSQLPIITSGQNVSSSSSSLIQMAKQLAGNPKDPPTWQLLATHSKTVSDSIKKLMQAIKYKAPGQSECDEAIDTINESIKEIDQVSLSAISQELYPVDDLSVQVSQEQMLNSCQQLDEWIDPSVKAGISEAEKLGHVVTSMCLYFDPLTKAAISSASKTGNNEKQMTLLDQTKTVLESGLQLIYAVKEGGGNQRAVKTHGAISEAGLGIRDAISDLQNTLQKYFNESGYASSMVETITKGIRLTEDNANYTDTYKTFVHYQTGMVRSCKEIIRVVQDMATKSNTHPDQLGALSGDLTKHYQLLCTDVNGAVATCNSEDFSRRLKISVAQLGKLCINLVENGSLVRDNPSDSIAKNDLMQDTRGAAERVSYILAALQSGSRGTQACINAVSAVSCLIGDLDTCILFASAGTLNTEPVSENFSDHKENILRTAKALVDDVKTLVTGAASSQEQLAQAAQSTVRTITGLVDVMKHGASSLSGDHPEAQLLLMNAVKDVAASLSELINATKMASGKTASDPSMGVLKNSAKHMVSNVTSLLKTVKSVEDNASRGTRAIESTIDFLKQEVYVLDSPDPPNTLATAEELLIAAKNITAATSRTVGAGNSCKQDELLSAANLSRSALVQLMKVVKGVAFGMDSDEAKEQALQTGKDCTYGFIALLQFIITELHGPTPDSRTRLSEYARVLAMSVSELVHCAESSKAESGWYNPDDPHAIAEKELLEAAASIEAAAYKLQQLRPTQKLKEIKELSFEDQIVEAAQSIANATSALMKAATYAQRELVLKGKIKLDRSSNVYHEDETWAHGLVSAARMVAAATTALCDAANGAAEGTGSEEKLIASARQVAAATAQLLVACRVKAGVDSEAMQRLQMAGNAVKRATDNLVLAAQKAATWSQETTTVIIEKHYVGSIKQEWSAQEEIIRKEKELEQARYHLENIRRAKYKNKPVESDNDL